MLLWLAILPLCLLGKKLPFTLTAGNPDGSKGEKDQPASASKPQMLMPSGQSLTVVKIISYACPLRNEPCVRGICEDHQW